MTQTPAILFTPLPTAAVRALQRGEPDAYGNKPEHGISDGLGAPCRHCLQDVPKGKGMLTLAYRPFPALQPYAETGPIFLCADPCEAPKPSAAIPAILASPDYIIRGYGANDRIVYGTGAVVPTKDIPAEAAARLADPAIAYVHVRSARNNCYQVRIDRAP